MRRLSTRIRGQVSRVASDESQKIETTRLHYGVDSPLQLPSLWQKSHESRKASGAYAKQSKAEDAFHAVLIELFGNDDVERWKLVQRWPIDFYVKSLDTYIQFDGEYWHGLDRPIELIRTSMKPRDRAIVGKWETDRRQVAWFAEHGMRLVRVTDVQFQFEPRECLRRVIGE